jgi:tetratricopeptide (TPR) repeat protein
LKETLADLLHADPSCLDAFAPAVLRLALSCPWCWPSDPTLGALAERRGFHRPAPPRPGQACILSVSCSRASIWLAEPVMVRAARQPGQALPEGGASPVANPWKELIGQAADVGTLAWKLAARDIAVLRTTRPLNLVKGWRAKQVGTVGSGPAELVLEGLSFGLSLCLAAASSLVEAAPPSDLVALAYVLPSGEIKSVDGLEQKLDVLAAWGLGVGRIVVAPEQKGVVEALVGARGMSATVHAPPRLAGALKLAYPNIVDRMSECWRDPACARQALDALFRQTLDDGSLLLGWRSVANVAGQLRTALEREPEQAWRAEIVESIALRHNDEARPIPWPRPEFLAALPRPLRLRLVAHIAQAAADSVHRRMAADAARSVIDRATRHLAPPADRHAEDFRVLGALGRAHAAIGEYDQAIARLQETVAGWAAILEVHQASYSLSELLRVLGVAGRAAEVETLVNGAVDAFLNEPRITPMSHGFVTIASGRALVMVGKAAAGLERLEENAAAWGDMPGHAQLQRLRWLALAHDDLGQRAEADEARRRLAHLIEHQDADGDTADPNGLLGRIDAALGDGHDVAPLLAQLVKHPEEGEQLRYCIGDARGEEAARRASRLYRY